MTGIEYPAFMREMVTSPEQIMYEGLITEQIEHYKATKNPEVSERAKKTIEKFIGFVKQNRSSSRNPVNILNFSGATDQVLEKYKEALFSELE